MKNTCGGTRDAACRTLAHVLYHYYNLEYKPALGLEIVTCKSIDKHLMVRFTAFDCFCLDSRVMINISQYERKRNFFSICCNSQFKTSNSVRKAIGLVLLKSAHMCSLVHH